MVWLVAGAIAVIDFLNTYGPDLAEVNIIKTLRGSAPIIVIGLGLLSLVAGATTGRCRSMSGRCATLSRRVATRQTPTLLPNGNRSGWQLSSTGSKTGHRSSPG